MRAPHILAAALLVHAVAFGISIKESALPAGDFDRYYEIASSAGRPYVDYQVENPIGTLLLFKVLVRLADTRSRFGLAIVAVNLIADAVIVAALLWGWGAEAAAFGAVMVVPVLGLFFNRVDPWSTAAAIAAIAAWKRHRPIAMGCALVIGAAFKMWPLVLAPLLATPWRGRESVTALSAFGLTAAAIGCGVLWFGGAAGVLQVLTFRGAQGWQIESLVGSLIHLNGSATPHFESGAWRIGSTSGAASIALFLAAAPVCLWSSWRGASLDRAGIGWIASVSTLLLLSALFSPQYMIWLAPAAGIAWVQGDRGLAALTLATMVVTQIMWSNYDGVKAGDPAALLTVVARNALMIVVAAWAIARLAGQTTGRQRKNQIPSTA